MSEPSKPSGHQREVAGQESLPKDAPATADLRKELKKNEMRLRAAWGDPFLPASAAVLTHAEAVVQRMTAGDDPRVSAPASGPGWAQGIAPNVLSDLASAYRSSHNESFALAAREIYAWRRRWNVRGSFRPMPHWSTSVPKPVEPYSPP